MGPLLRSPDRLSSHAWASAPTERDKTNSPRQSGGGKSQLGEDRQPVAPSMFIGNPPAFAFLQEPLPQLRGQWRRRALRRALAVDGCIDEVVTSLGARGSTG